jgi:hypothetical protein
MYVAAKGISTSIKLTAAIGRHFGFTEGLPPGVPAGGITGILSPDEGASVSFGDRHRQAA